MNSSLREFSREKSADFIHLLYKKSHEVRQSDEKKHHKIQQSVEIKCRKDYQSFARKNCKNRHSFVEKITKFVNRSLENEWRKSSNLC